MAATSRIIIEFTPAKDMRYRTLGDYFKDADGNTTIQVSDEHYTGNGLASDEERFLIALHEMVEMRLCLSRGITFETVDAFDLGKSEYAQLYDLELGDMEGCPYGKEHRFAMLMEQLMAHELGIRNYGKVE